MKDIALADGATEALLKCLRGVPFLRVEKESKAASSRTDLRLQVKTPGGKSTLVVEVRKVGQPRVIREATNQLLRFKKELPGAYGVVMAPYISPQAAEICLKEGFGFADLAGNCLLSFDQVFISKEGKENSFARKRDLRSLYSPKAERVLRVVLSGPGRWWKVQSLAKEAGVSLGQGFNVKKLLVDREWMETGEDGFRLTAPAKLLAEWEENYDFRRSAVREFYTLRPIVEFEGLLGEACAKDKSAYALAGFSSAARYAPMVRYQRAMAYVVGNLDRLAKGLELKPVTSGANVNLIAPYDDGVFYGAETKGDARVTSPVQTYLDLRQIKGRGEQAADCLKQQVIQPSWPENA
ncbi:MAG TPA: type IV toxin-antitoxin system AbiEi family antitoxin [Dongiaceae bacterium]|nr:type IV toxin-antitoxin system AbiEi family antitoxin [Dongiaceae bacterium]